MEKRTRIEPFIGGYQLVFTSEVIDGELMDTTVELRQRGDNVGAVLLTIAGDCITQFYSELMDPIERHRI